MWREPLRRSTSSALYGRLIPAQRGFVFHSASRFCILPFVLATGGLRSMYKFPGHLRGDPQSSRFFALQSYGAAGKKRIGLIASRLVLKITPGWRQVPADLESFSHAFVGLQGRL